MTARARASAKEVAAGSGRRSCSWVESHTHHDPRGGSRSRTSSSMGSQQVYHLECGCSGREGIWHWLRQGSVFRGPQLVHQHKTFKKKSATSCGRRTWEGVGAGGRKEGRRDEVEGERRLRHTTSWVLRLIKRLCHSLAAAAKAASPATGSAIRAAS